MPLVLLSLEQRLKMRKSGLGVMPKIQGFRKLFRFQCLSMRASECACSCRTIRLSLIKGHCLQSVNISRGWGLSSFTISVSIVLVGCNAFSLTCSFFPPFPKRTLLHLVEFSCPKVYAHGYSLHSLSRGRIDLRQQDLLAIPFTFIESLRGVSSQQPKGDYDRQK